MMDACWSEDACQKVRSHPSDPGNGCQVNAYVSVLGAIGGLDTLCVSQGVIKGLSGSADHNQALTQG